jgi:hypothetical protein
MSRLKQRASLALNDRLKKRGFQLIKNAELNNLLRESGRLSSRNGEHPSLPEEMTSYLRFDNPRLQELKRGYRNHPASASSQWSEGYLNRELSLQAFRGDGAYLYQGRMAGELRYILATYYCKTVDRLGLLGQLADDELFGNQTFEIDGELRVSRDLLDSVLEINFLETQIGISQLQSPNVLDIGAGYGRLAHRLVSSLPNLGRVFCTDGVPESTFLCEYYLKVRGVNEKAVAVPLYEIDEVMEANEIDLAINIHSFAECPISAIRSWLDLLQNHRVKFLFLVENQPHLLSAEKDNTRIDFLPDLQARGYQLRTVQPKYGNATSMQKYAAFPAYYFLLELSE